MCGVSPGARVGAVGSLVHCENLFHYHITEGEIIQSKLLDGRDHHMPLPCWAENGLDEDAAHLIR